MRQSSLLFVIAFLVTLSISCNQEDDDLPIPDNIGQIVLREPSFSLLATAAARANVAVTLAGSKDITVFAPDNDAFAASGITEATINSLPEETLKNILLFHVLPSRTPSVKLPAGPNSPLTAVNGGTLYITSNSSGAFVNGVRVKTPDVIALNGIVHVVSKVLLPPVGNIVETAVQNPELSYLVAAVTRADASGTSISGALSAAGPLTVFAPTNQAFIAAGFPTIDSIQKANPATLRDILLYHVISGRVFSSELTEGARPATALGDTVTITLSGGAKVKGDGNASASSVVASDVLATNGVVHVIDQVLLPD